VPFLVAERGPDADLFVLHLFAALAEGALPDLHTHSRRRPPCARLWTRGPGHETIRPGESTLRLRLALVVPHLVDLAVTKIVINRPAEDGVEMRRPCRRLCLCRRPQRADDAYHAGAAETVLNFIRHIRDRLPPKAFIAGRQRERRATALR
jgi:hypothetical protein